MPTFSLRPGAVLLCMTRNASDQSFSPATALWPFTALRSVGDLFMGSSSLSSKRPAHISFDDVPENAILTPQAWRDFQQGHSLQSLLETGSARLLEHPWQISQWNAWLLQEELSDKLSCSRSAIPSGVTVVGSTAAVWVDPSATLEPCILVTTDGPIWIEAGVHIMAGATLRGPLYVGHHSVVKMNAALYGGTSVGKHCVVGGEVKNSVLMGYSNKAHEGYLGDSVLGYWCNLGAGTTNSNLKNTGGSVRVWQPHRGETLEAGQKVGLLLGDFSRSAILTRFLTGSIVGVCSHVLDPNPPKYLPDFSWGAGRYNWEKVIADIRIWMQFKSQEPDEALLAQLHHIYHQPISI